MPLVELRMVAVVAVLGSMLPGCAAVQSGSSKQKAVRTEPSQRAEVSRPKPSPSPRVDPARSTTRQFEVPLEELKNLVLASPRALTEKGWQRSVMSPRGEPNVFTLKFSQEHACTLHLGAAQGRGSATVTIACDDVRGAPNPPVAARNIEKDYLNVLATTVETSRRGPPPQSTAGVRAPTAPAAATSAPAATAQAADPGMVALQAALDFNVLDALSFNPKTGYLTLVGHRDPRYGDAKIPYLEHLAELIERPDPGFTLHWTPDSEARVRDLFRRLDSPDEVRRLAAQWGYWINEHGQVTPMGRHFMPIFGVTPTNDRYEIIASMFRAVGNTRAADVMSAFGRARRAENTPGEQAAMQNVVAVVGALDDLNRLKARVQRREISDWEGQLGFGRAVTSRMDAAFGLTGQPSRTAFERVMHSRRDLAAAFTAAFAETDRQLRVILGPVMQQLLARHDQVTVPPDVIQATVGIRPEVVPEYLGVNPKSQLARVLFEADYIGKQLPNRPDLEKKISRYLTDFSYERTNPAELGRFRPTVTQRLWISVDGVNATQSADGGTLYTRGATMRFNIRDKVNGASAPTGTSGYERLLTSLYDDLSREFPVLHELRETAKLMAAAHWLRGRSRDLRLSVIARTPWNGPSRAPGLVYMSWTPNPRPGAVTATMMAMGGVSLRVKPPFDSTTLVVAPRDIPFDRTMPDWRSAGLPRSGATPGWMASLLGVEPFPTPAGGVATFDAGGRPAQAVTVAVPTSPSRPGTIAPVRPPGGGVVKQTRQSPPSTTIWRAGELEATERAYRERIVKTPADPYRRATLKLLLARLLHEKGDDKAAIAELKDAVRLAPAHPLVHLLYAEALAQEGDAQGAVIALRQYVSPRPGKPSGGGAASPAAGVGDSADAWPRPASDSGARVRASDRALSQRSAGRRRRSRRRGGQRLRRRHAMATGSVSVSRSAAATG